MEVAIQVPQPAVLVELVELFAIPARPGIMAGPVTMATFQKEMKYLAAVKKEPKPPDLGMMAGVEVVEFTKHKQHSEQEYSE